MIQHINPGTDTTINPVIINDTHRQQPKKYDYRCWIKGEHDCDGKCDSDPFPERQCGLSCNHCQCTACNQAEQQQGGVSE